jgi:hypothetical protein
VKKVLRTFSTDENLRFSRTLRVRDRIPAIPQAVYLSTACLPGNGDTRMVGKTMPHPVAGVFTAATPESAGFRPTKGRSRFSGQQDARQERRPILPGPEACQFDSPGVPWVKYGTLQTACPGVWLVLLLHGGSAFDRQAGTIQP